MAFLTNESVIAQIKSNCSSTSIKLFKHAVLMTNAPSRTWFYGYDSNISVTFWITLDLYAHSKKYKSWYTLIVIENVL